MAAGIRTAFEPSELRLIASYRDSRVRFVTFQPRDLERIASVDLGREGPA